MLRNSVAFGTSKSCTPGQAPALPNSCRECRTAPKALSLPCPSDAGMAPQLLLAGQNVEQRHFHLCTVEGLVMVKGVPRKMMPKSRAGHPSRPYGRRTTDVASTGIKSTASGPTPQHRATATQGHQPHWGTGTFPIPVREEPLLCEAAPHPHCWQHCCWVCANLGPTQGKWLL